jgi:hypothetical protein
MSKQNIIFNAMTNAVTKINCEAAGLPAPSLWDWLLPWRAYRWQWRARRVLSAVYGRWRMPELEKGSGRPTGREAPIQEPVRGQPVG